MMAEYIEREKAYPLAKRICDAIDSEDFQRLNFGMRILDWIDDLPAADVRPVVLCRDCINYVESEEANGEKMCVRDADWSVEDGCYYGFTEYPSPDWFCAGGKKREES